MSVSIFNIRIITFVKCHECDWFDLHHSVVNASMPVESYSKNHPKTSLDWNWYWLVGLFFYHYSNHIQPIHFQTFAEWKSSKLFVFFFAVKIWEPEASPCRFFGFPILSKFFRMIFFHTPKPFRIFFFEATFQWNHTLLCYWGLLQLYEFEFSFGLCLDKKY